MQKKLQIVWKILKVVLPILIVLGVGWQFWSLLRRPELWEQPLTIRPIPLILAGLLYVLTHTLWATFWVQLLHNQGAQVPWAVGVRAYFVSQLGKYVPGKAWVIVLRVAMLRHLAPSRSMLVLTGLYETLTSMAGGAMVGGLLLAWVPGVGDTIQNRQWMLIPLACMPLGFVLLHRLARRLNRKFNPGNQMPPLPFSLMLRGILQTSLGWAMLGLSLWLTMVGILPESPEFSRDAWLRSTGINAIAYVMGFVVLVAPGGVGVREFFLQRLLAAELALYWMTGEPSGLAVVVTLVLRLLWTFAEFVAMGLLVWWVPVPKDSGTTAAADPVQEGRS
ncbi:lysylphosphatidylglycerol synthase transmembrane domain-containing protein [Tuwongella immobilis]|uniref:Flippase-like domain-containing protein n=1 Tax=Tuwongella immobilis TaxID=692036 RepID=A0A6C2YKP9_9BACT|nr:lysylphosphatidylglycerol synthase domain-containing protein [Tuwongella immobilis]VIP02006.1 Uncharacterized protein OS=Isosphaera pallida (strain ATCC 43644 / DSM 9630 / IS1B) GN=Isop_0361 PE=4 SV=1: UPF0104 [Tuwongella immobilis]VTS00105.1 Uncharacterized protein OS=Isosphaera pallida (strain ATCC 43644 / DSM 9630 / IS1B) GN=Isop_0361 PE=4 SV=1: UPF0104 [Tuwongella immobilis]